PTPHFMEMGNLPQGVSFNANSAILEGAPATGTHGTYTITITAIDLVGSSETETFALNVNTAQESANIDQTDTQVAQGGVVPAAIVAAPGGGTDLVQNLTNITGPAAVYVASYSSNPTGASPDST